MKLWHFQGNRFTSKRSFSYLEKIWFTSEGVIKVRVVDVDKQQVPDASSSSISIGISLPLTDKVDGFFGEFEFK